VVSTPVDLSHVSEIQRWRWTIELARAKLALEPGYVELNSTLDEIAEALVVKSLTSLDALEARSALLELRPQHAALREWHERELKRLEGNLPLHLQGAFRRHWTLR
jgi:hypothetical protein